MRKYFTIFLLACFCVTTNAQSYQIPINQFVQATFERNIPDSEMPAFTAVRPYQTKWLQPWMQTFTDDTTHKLNRWKNGNFIRYSDAQFSVWANPTFTFLAGHSTGSGTSKSTFQNSRGVQVGANLGSNITLGFGFTENQASFPDFVDKYISSSRSFASGINPNRVPAIVPGMGAAKDYSGNEYDFAFSDAYLRWTPGKIASVTLGYGQNFLGEGYRSLFLSDNSFNYPYLHVNINFKKFNYSAFYNQYQNVFYQFTPALAVQSSPSYQQKWSVMHYLTVKLGKRWQVGVFDGIIWAADDSTNKSNRGLDVAYLNPVPFLRPLEFSRGSADNSVLGLHAKFIAAKHTYIYAQLFLDDINLQLSSQSGKQHLNNKYAIQLGAKRYSKIKDFEVFSRLEYNYSRPYVYDHREPSLSYTNYQQPLAHPLGANFHEAIVQLSASKKRWYAETTNQFALVGRQDVDVKYNQGNNLFGGEANVPGFGSYTLQGIKNTQLTSYCGLGYILNPRWNLALEASILYKNVKADNAVAESTTWFRFGIVTRLRNMYLDF